MTNSKVVRRNVGAPVTNSVKAVKPRVAAVTKVKVKAVDDDSELVVYQGASMSQICRIFSMDARDVKAKLMNAPIKSCGERRGHPIYQIADVAPYLVAPPYDIDDFIQKMSIADLPMILRKEYWAGMRSRQLYEKENAELWPTSKVVDTVSTLLKTLRMSLLLSREAVERETDLSVRQRDIIARIIDNALEDCYATTTIEFAKAPIGTTDFRPSKVPDTEDL